jgi:hypothetical protein
MCLVRIKLTVCVPLALGVFLMLDGAGEAAISGDSTHAVAL